MILDLGFERLPVAYNALLFAAAAVCIWLAGSRLSALAVAISNSWHLGKAIMGLVFLAAVTELPEVVTTFTAALSGNAALVLNNMFGGIAMQTAILALADLFAVHAALTFYPRKPTCALEAALLALLLAALLAILLVGEVEIIWNIGLGSVGLAAAYVGSVYLLRTYDKRAGWVPVEKPDIGEDDMAGAVDAPPAHLTRPALIARFAAASAVILVCGVVLVQLAQALAGQTGLGNSFIGVTVLAASTSLPELSTTISAVRLGAYTMAISNIFGSNLIMLALLLPADILYRPGPILKFVDKSAEFALISGILVTAVYLVGLLIRRKKQILGMGVDSFLVAILYALSLVVFYQLR